MLNRQPPTHTPTRFQRFKSTTNSVIRYVARSRPVKLSIACVCGGLGTASIVKEWLPIGLNAIPLTLPVAGIVTVTAATFFVALSIFTYRGYVASLDGMDQIAILEERINRLTSTATHTEELSHNEMHALELFQRQLTVLARRIENNKEHLRFFDRHAQLTAVGASKRDNFLSKLEEEQKKISIDLKADQVEVNINTTFKALQALRTSQGERRQAELSPTASLPLDRETEESESELFDGAQSQSQRQLFSPHAQLPGVFSESRRPSGADTAQKGVELKEMKSSARSTSVGDALHSDHDEAQSTPISIVVQSQQGAPHKPHRLQLLSPKQVSYGALSDSSQTPTVSASPYASPA